MDKHLKKDRNNIEDILPLTPIQKAMLYQFLIKPNGEEYYEQIRYKLYGHVDSKLVSEVWNCIAAQNEMLRAVVRWKGLREPIQMILKEREVPFTFHDFSQLEGNIQAMIDYIALQDWNSKVDIAEELIKITLCKVSEKHYEMIVNTHHILMDGWSNAIIMKEFKEIYEVLYSGDCFIKKNKTRYKEYISWYNLGNKKADLEFWNQYLRDYATSDCSDKKIANKVITCNSHYYSFSLDKSLVEIIYGFVRMYQLTLAVLLYTAWGILLYQNDRSEDIIFGITKSGRDSEINGIENMVGLFIKTFPIRIKIQPDMPIKGLMNEISHVLTMIEKHQKVSLSEILSREVINTEINLKSAVVLQNYPLDSDLSNDSSSPLKIKLHSTRYATNLNITLGVKTFDDEIKLDFNYDSNLYNISHIREHCDHLVSILENIVKYDQENATVQKIIEICSYDNEKIDQSVLDLQRIDEVEFDEIF